MAEENDRTFEVALRLTGREVVAVKIFSSSPSQKWLWMSLGAILAIAAGFVLYGSNIATVYRSF